VNINCQKLTFATGIATFNQTTNRISESITDLQAFLRKKDFSYSPPSTHTEGGGTPNKKRLDNAAALCSSLQYKSTGMLIHYLQLVPTESVSKKKLTTEHTCNFWIAPKRSAGAGGRVRTEAEPRSPLKLGRSRGVRLQRGTSLPAAGQ